MRHQSLVIALARQANARGFHFGAIVFDGPRLISTGWCQEKGHTLQSLVSKRAGGVKKNNSWLHAEVHAIIASRGKCDGAEIAVARWAVGRVRNSYPCAACQLAIEAAGLRRLWFYDERKESFVKERL